MYKILKSVQFRLRVGLSPVKARKKKQNFIDTPVVDVCCYGTEHFLVYCSYLRILRQLVWRVHSFAAPRFSTLPSAFAEGVLPENGVRLSGAQVGQPGPKFRWRSVHKTADFRSTGGLAISPGISRNVGTI